MSGASANESQPTQICVWPDLTIDRLAQELSKDYPSKHHQLRIGLEQLSDEGFDLRDVASCIYGDPAVIHRIMEGDVHLAAERIKKRLKDSREELKDIRFELISVFLRDGFSICDAAWIFRNMLDINSISEPSELKQIMPSLHQRFANGGQRIHDIGTYSPQSIDTNNIAISRPEAATKWQDPFSRPEKAEARAAIEERASTVIPKSLPSTEKRQSKAIPEQVKVPLATRLLLATAGGFILAAGLFYGLYGFVDGRGVFAMAAIIVPFLYGLSRGEKSEKTIGVVFLCVFILVIFRAFSTGLTDDYNHWPAI